MKTSDAIKQQALELFNLKGCQSVTLRDIAEALQKSYGNITYHFKNKTILIMSLYADMVNEIAVETRDIKTQIEVFKSIMEAPALSWTVSVKYQFLYRDFNELSRHYPDLAKHVKVSNTERMNRYYAVLRALQKAGLLESDLKKDDLMYLMKLSGIMRTWFFMEHPHTELRKKSTRRKYIDSVNRLLFPYLSKKGKKAYNRIKKELH